MNTIAINSQQDLMRPVIKIVQDGLTSQRSKRAYGDALESFIGWYTTDGQTGLNKATVQSYKTLLEARGLAPSSINQQLRE